MEDLSLDSIRSAKWLKIKADHELQVSSFALEITDYLSDYTPERGIEFQENTYITPQLQRISKAVQSSLQESKKDSVFIFDAEFGGGKTHNLLAILESSQKHLDKPAVIIDGHKISKQTLWGEIAEKLPNEDLKISLKKYEKDLEVPPYDLIKEIVEEFSLLLVDEFPVYLKKTQSKMVGNTSLSELTIAFFHTLLVEINRQRGKIAILSLPGEEASYIRETQQLQEKIKSIVYRQGEISQATREQDILPIIQKRLIPHIKKETIPFDQLAVEFQTLQKLNSLNTSTFQLTSETLQTFYPFHPAFISILWKNLSRSPNFQQLRGMLRLISKFTTQDPSLQGLLWTLGDLQIEDELFDEIFPKLELYELGKCFQEDIAQLPSHLHYLARTVVLASINSDGIHRDQLLWTSFNGTKSLNKILEDLSELETLSLYLQRTKDQFHYGTEPSLYRIIIQEANDIDRKTADGVHNQLVHQIFGNDVFELHIGELKSLSKQRLNIFVQHYNDMTPLSEHFKSVTHRNILFGLQSTNAPEYYSLLQQVEILNRMNDKTSSWKKSQKQQYERINEFIRLQLKLQFAAVYSHLCYYQKGELQTFNLPSTQIEDISNFSGFIYKELEQNHIIISEMTPQYIFDTFDEEIMNIQELYLFFLRDTSIRALGGANVLRNCLLAGVEQQLWVLATSKQEPTVQNLSTIGKLILYTNDDRFAKFGSILIPEEFPEEFSGNLYLIPRKLLLEVLSDIPKLGEADTVFLESSQITKYLKKQIIDYSLSVKAPSKQLLTDLQNTVSKLKLSYGLAQADLKVSLKHEKDTIFTVAWNETSINALYTLVQQLMGVFPLVEKFTDVELELVISEFQENSEINLKFCQAMNDLHKHKGDLFLTLK